MPAAFFRRLFRTASLRPPRFAALLEAGKKGVKLPAVMLFSSGFLVIFQGIAQKNVLCNHSVIKDFCHIFNLLEQLTYSCKIYLFS
jgi:hypothetical protein